MLNAKMLVLACEPGQITVFFVTLFRFSWAIDLEPEIVEAGKKEANQ
ncbi:MAG: hypothetical protein ACOYIF_12410 [Acetivibrionales bacterium]|jgi:hypothetical protein